MFLASETPRTFSAFCGPCSYSPNRLAPGVPPMSAVAATTPPTTGYFPGCRWDGGAIDHVCYKTAALASVVQLLRRIGFTGLGQTN